MVDSQTVRETYDELLENLHITREISLHEKSDALRTLSELYSDGERAGYADAEDCAVCPECGV